MKHAGTSPEVFEEVIEFAKAIAMIPIPIHKEQPGYISNTLLIPDATAAMQLAVDEAADPKVVDKTWIITTGSQFGPFGLLDEVGPTTPCNSLKSSGEAGDEGSARLAEWLKTENIDKGRMGTANGKGIYIYPNPEYSNPDVLK